jgi:hypothetical protein
VRLPHIRCECCRSLHPLRKVAGGWLFDCDWARIPGQRAPDRFPMVYLERTPLSKAEREGGPLAAALRKGSRSAVPRVPIRPAAWLSALSQQGEDLPPSG